MAAYSSPLGRTPAAGEGIVGYPAGHVSQPPDPERVRKAARRVDSENKHPATEPGRSRGGERSRDRRLSDAAWPAYDDDLLGRQELFQMTRLLQFRRWPSPPGNRTTPGI